MSPYGNEDYWDLVFRIVPDEGVADTVQGELVRAVLRLTAEFRREGCGNWDDYFEALADFAEAAFSDGTLDAPTADQACSVLRRLRDFGRTAGSHPPAVLEAFCRELRDEALEGAAVQWCQRHPAPIPFVPGPDYEAQY
jgi:hypothetical protein